MGYGYSATGALCCDSCGKTGGVRKRTCTARVAYPQDGPDRSIPYCYPPALCGPCFTRRGGNAGIHKDCAGYAAKSTAENQVIADRIAAGDLQVMSAYGSWHKDVPEGSTGVLFAPNRTDRWQEQTYRLVPKDDYDPGKKKFLSDYPNASPWAGPREAA
jgi:hypothetical protein